MNTQYNSSALAKQVAEKLNFSTEEENVLYGELSQIPNGLAKRAFAELTKSDAKALNKYIACIKGSCVNGRFYSKDMEAAPYDEDAWIDLAKRPVFLSIIEAETPTRAKQLAIMQAGLGSVIHPDNVEIYEI